MKMITAKLTDTDFFTMLSFEKDKQVKEFIKYQNRYLNDQWYKPIWQEKEHPERIQELRAVDLKEKTEREKLVQRILYKNRTFEIKNLQHTQNIYWVGIEHPVEHLKGYNTPRSQTPIDLIGWNRDTCETIIVELKYDTRCKMNSVNPLYALMEGIEYSYISNANKAHIQQAKRRIRQDHLKSEHNHLLEQEFIKNAFNKIVLVVAANTEYWQVWEDKIKKTHVLKFKGDATKTVDAIESFKKSVSNWVNQIKFIRKVYWLNIGEPIDHTGNENPNYTFSSCEAWNF